MYPVEGKGRPGGGEWWILSGDWWVPADSKCKKLGAEKEGHTEKENSNNGEWGRNCGGRYSSTPACSFKGIKGGGLDGKRKTGKEGSRVEKKLDGVGRGGKKTFHKSDWG